MAVRQPRYSKEEFATNRYRERVQQVFGAGVDRFKHHAQTIKQVK